MSNKMTKKVSGAKGFTLLEILLVVGIISILAGIVILAINPTKQLGDTRNAERRSDVLTILNAIYQYSIDNNGLLSTITNGGGAITPSDTCDTSGTDALLLSDKLVGTDAKYLVGIPTDPNAADKTSLAEYYVVASPTTGRITVCAPDTENGITPAIYVTR